MLALRPERPSDYPAIYTLNKLAFVGEIEARLVEKLRQGPAYIPGLSLVAEQNDQIVGHILFSLVEIRQAAQTTPLLSLAPMAVLPEFQNQGIGSWLVREGLAKCRQTGYPGVIVLGHPGYYPRFGFTAAAEKGLRLPFDAPAEAFMVYELYPHSLDGIQGLVVYPPEFGED